MFRIELQWNESQQLVATVLKDDQSWDSTTTGPWTEEEYLAHWAIMTYYLLDCRSHGTGLLLRGSMAASDLTPVRAFRVIVMRGNYWFDDVIVESPWKNPSCKAATLAEAIRPQPDLWIRTGAIPVFEVTREELELWHVALPEPGDAEHLSDGVDAIWL